MLVEVIGRDFDRLTQAHTNLQSCTYLLQLLDENAIASKEYSSAPLIDACARAYLYEAQMRELDVMRDVFECVSSPRAERMLQKEQATM